MNIERSIIELAGEFVAGTLCDEAMKGFEYRLREDAEAQQAVAAWETRIETFLGTTALAALRESDKSWVEIAPGISGRTLHYDHQVGSMIYVVCMQPGARCQTAVSGSPEECLLISGDLSFETVVLKSGDEHHAPNSVIHGGGHSETGAVLFIRARDA